MAHTKSFHNSPHSAVQAGVAHYLRQHPQARLEQDNHRIGIASNEPTLKQVSAILARLPRRRAGDPLSRDVIGLSDATDGSVENCVSLLADYAAALVDNNPTEAAELASLYSKSSCDDLGWTNAVLAYLSAELDGDSIQYTSPSSDTDSSFIYPLPEKTSLTIGIIGDWGTGELAAQQVITALMGTPDLDVIIHVGDVYYAGTSDEVQSNYLDLINEARSTTNCNIPIYNLPGNHDYYTAGQAFYSALSQVNQDTAFLASTTASPTSPPAVSTQTASFFSLQNTWLQLQGMDTGYFDSDIFDVNYDTTMLNSAEASWHLEQLKNAATNQRAVFLFSHHQPWSGCEQIGDGPGTAFDGGSESSMTYLWYNVNLQSQLGTAPTGTVKAWFWGHEHVLEVYDQTAISSSSEVPIGDGTTQSLSSLFPWVPYGACIGYSAFPMFDTDNPYNLAENEGTLNGACPVSYNQNYLLGQTTNDATVYNHGFAVLQVTNNGSGSVSATVSYYQLPADGSSGTATLVNNAVSTICGDAAVA